MTSQPLSHERRLLAFPLPVGIAAAVLLLSACGGSTTTTATPRSVTVYVSTDRVFSEPVLEEYQRQSGVIVNPVYDTEETKSTGLANRLIAEPTGRRQTCSGRTSRSARSC
jgi:hypothetical protein